ncbi:MAG TPA: HipA family kinase [Solirubrobacteraceae bacterium]|nr:HipA family kinase [Solirubrobacteraceae bacterium]
MTAVRYAGPLREGGSLPGLVEADDDGLYVVKFRAAGQGAKALVAEIIVGELGRALDLPVPEIVLVDVPAPLGRTEPDPEINELVTASAGINVGLDFLPGALDLNAARLDLVDPQLAAAIVWFDALATNVDRTPRNPNLLIWHRRPWLIDHGAALYQHHRDEDLPARAGDPFPLIRDHVLLPRAADLQAADARLAPRLDPQRIAEIVTLVPDTLLGEDPGRDRERYVEYFERRLRAPRPFLASAEAARAG